jgi:pimeloyl-ACP methyl ester carboxylesterase
MREYQVRIYEGARGEIPRAYSASSKLTDPAAYHSATMAEDVRALLDHLSIERADVMGYSMGARIAAFLAVDHPQRVRAAVFGGLGIHLVEGVGQSERIAEAMEAPSLAAVRDPTGRVFRSFTEQTKSDLKALAACMRGSRQTLSREQVAGIRVPVLVAVGTNDNVAGSAQDMAALIPGAQALDIPSAITCWRSAIRCSKRACSTSLTNATEPGA